jgi:hypothetical protein
MQDIYCIPWNYCQSCITSSVSTRPGKGGIKFMLFVKFWNGSIFYLYSHELHTTVIMHCLSYYFKHLSYPCFNSNLQILLYSHFKPLKPELVWTRFIIHSCLKENITFRHYEDQLVKTVQGDNPYLHWESYSIHKYEIHSYLLLKRLVYMATARLLRLNLKNCVCVCVCVNTSRGKTEALWTTKTKSCIICQSEEQNLLLLILFRLMGVTITAIYKRVKNLLTS